MIEWIEASCIVLERYGFNEQWIDWVKGMIVEYCVSILVNGSLHGF